MKKTFNLIILSVVLGLAGWIAWFLTVAITPVPDRALIAGEKTEAEIAEVLKSLSRDQLTELETRELSAFKAEPLERSALQNLVILNSLAGNKQKSDSIAQVLAKYSRRSIGAQLAAMQIDFSKGELESGFGRMDGVLRARPEFSKILFSSMKAQIADKKARAALASIIAKDPPWRAKFFEEVLVNDNKGVASYAILSAIRTAGGKVHDLEKRDLLIQLAKAKQYDQAYFVWLDLLPPSDMVRVKNVFDGGFDVTPKQMIFDWNIWNRKSARFDVIPRPGQAGNGVLRAEFYADTVGSQYIYQYLRLAPGKYSLSFDVQVDSIKNETGLVVRVGCLGGPLLAESKPILEKGPWETRSDEFAVSGDDCGTQFLRVENRSSAVLDREISGRFLFDNFNIVEAGAKKAAENSENP
jgi:hypothetical protein